MTEPTFDILIAGAGPAGLALSAALADRAPDLRIGLLSPSHPAPWPNTYGAWLDELEAADEADCTDHIWHDPTVATGAHRLHRLDRAYALIDNDALRASLRERARDGGVEEISAVATGYTRSSEETLVVRSRGERAWEATLVFDATGHRPTLLTTPQGDPGYQRAWGIVADVTGDPIPGDSRMTLMDYRSDYLAGETDREPTFLYAMQLDDQRYFLEETSLVARPPVEFDTLEERLNRRMTARGVTVDRVVETERVSFPMGQPLPTSDQPVVGFGAASGMVHPATGYMVGPMLGRVDRVAGAAADSVRRLSSVDQRAARVWKSVWPSELRGTRHLLTFGLETLLGLEADVLRDFFDAFFKLDRTDWGVYMSGEGSPAATARIMATVFRHASIELRGELMRRALSREAYHLVRALIPNRP